MQLPEGYTPDSAVDHDAMDPVWLQVAAILTARIDAGQYPKGRQIPSLAALRDEFGIAKGTAVKAVSALEDQGRVRGVKGKGVYVL